MLLGGLGAFERASVATIKSSCAWVAALGGLCFGVLLFSPAAAASRSARWCMFGPLL